MSDQEKKPQHIGFYVRTIDAGMYSIRLDLSYLLLDRDVVRHFIHWMLNRNEGDKLYIYLEGGATANVWLAGKIAINCLSTAVKAIELCPAYENIKLIVPQMLTGIGSYLVLTTPNVRWGPLGFVSFDGWTKGKRVEDYDESERSDISWLQNYFRRGVDLGLFTEQEVEQYNDGQTITVGLEKKLKTLDG